MVIALIIGFGSSCSQLVNIKVKTQTNSQAQGTASLGMSPAHRTESSYFIHFVFLTVRLISQLRASFPAFFLALGLLAFQPWHMTKLMLKLRTKISNLRAYLQHFHGIRFKYQAASSLVANHSCWPSLRMFYLSFCSSSVTLNPLVANNSSMHQESTELCASLLARALLSSCSPARGLLVKLRSVGTRYTQCPHQMLHAYPLPLSNSRQFSGLWVTAVPSGARAVEEQHSGVLAQHNHIQTYCEQKYHSCALFGAGAVTWALSHSHVLRENLCKPGGHFGRKQCLANFLWLCLKRQAAWGDIYNNLLCFPKEKNPPV